MAQIVDPHIRNTRFPSKPTPHFLDINKVCAFPLTDNHVGIVFDARHADKISAAGGLSQISFRPVFGIWQL